MPDKEIICKECNRTFLFTENEQAFYKEKGFENEPQRCPECRAMRKQQGRGRTERRMYPAVCAQCGVHTTVPFEPTGDRPVYCRDCYQPDRHR